MYNYKFKIDRIIDGDTFEGMVSLGLNSYMNIRIRVLELDTPEKFGEEKELGLICKAYAEKILEGKEVIINTVKSDETEAGTDSFGRWLAYVKFEDGSDWTGLLTSLGVNKYEDNYSPQNVYELKEKFDL